MTDTMDLNRSRIKITSNKEKIELVKGQTDKITITSSGQQISLIANGFKPSLDATIDIKDLDIGEYSLQVTATDYDFGNKSVFIPISIKEQVLTPATLTLSKEDTKIVKGGSEEITVTAEDPNNWNFINPNPTLIKLEKIGNNKIKITGLVVSDETLVIPVTASKEDKKDTTKTISVKVLEDTILQIKPTQPQSVRIGEKVNITAITNADTIQAESNDTDKATVEVSGKNVAITGVANGTSTITIKAKKGDAPEKQVTATANVIFAQDVQFELSSVNGNVQKGQTKEVNITGLTSGADFTVTSKNTNIATVQKSNNKFTITALQVEGDFTIEVVGTKSDMNSTTKTYIGKVVQ